MNVTWILIRREFIERVRQKSFVWATALGAVGIILLALLPQVLSSFSHSNATRLLIVAPDATSAADTLMSLKSTGDALTVASMHAAGPDLPPPVRAQMAKDLYDAALVEYRDAHHHLAYAYYPKTSSALSDSGTIHDAVQRAALLGDAGPQRPAIEKSLKFKFEVHSLNTRYKNEADEFFSIGIVYFLLVILYIAVIVYGMQVATGVIEEKANRIMEIMIGAVRPSQLLAGKIFGISAVALLQLSINALAAAVAAVIAGVLYGAGAASQHAATAAAASPQAQATMSRILSEGLPSVPWATLGFLIVFFFLGLGMWLFPRTAPEHYAENQSAIARNRPVQLAVGAIIMGFSIWFAISICIASLDKYWLLQPAVQAVIVALVGVVIYAFRSGSSRRAAAIPAPES